MTFQMMLFPDFKEKALTLSYDDGTIHDKRLVEIMSKYGLKGTFNLNSCNLEDASYRVTADELKEVYLDTGNEIAVHGYRHLSLSAISEAQMVEEVFADRKNLEKITGQIITGMAYANGSYDDRTVGVLKACGISYARTVISTCNFNICDDWLRLPATCHHENAQLFELANKFLSNERNRYFWANAPKLFYLWGHSYEFANNNNWERIEQFAQIVGKHEDVWYATNGEIVRYVEAFKSLIFSADSSLVHNPSSTDVYIRTLSDKHVLVPAGKTVALS